MQHKNRLSTDEVFKLLHDLRGPLVNAKVLGTELGNSIVDLSTAIENSRPGLSDQHHEVINEIISEDLVACTGMLAASIDKLQERIKEIEQRYTI